MSKWEGNIISKDARYRTQTANQARGVYSLQDQLRFKSNDHWPSPFNGWPSNTGQRAPITLITTTVNADNSDDFSVYHNDMDAAAALGLTGRLYIAIKANSGVSYYNDLCIGAVQITSDDYTNLEFGWSFNVLADYTEWQYATVTGFGTTNAGDENYTDIVSATSQTWASCVNGVLNGRISRSNGTGSQRTGADGGVADAYSDSSTGTIISGVTSSIAQASGSTYYLYTESSGNPNSNYTGKWWWIRSPEVTLDGNGDKNMSITYHACTSTGS